MSGGVDSTVAAALLRDAGFEVMGITMKLFPGDAGNEPADRAAAVARRLGIVHHTVDLTDVFDRRIATYFTDTYLAGRTPNPCVLCNRLIKWELLGETARTHGCDLFATGHYVRIARFPDGSLTLVRGKDTGKDQSYFLWRLDTNLLARTLFPLGAMTKDEVRAHARSLDIETSERPESQEICFIPDNDYRAWLERRMAGKPLPETMTGGDILDHTGARPGRHRGVAYYTIGQRRGLGIAAGEPRYVTGLDAVTNTVTIGPRERLARTACTVSNLHWIRGGAPDARVRCTAQLRYRHRGVTATVIPGEGMVRFDESQDAVTPGQSAVFYDGDCVLGGGIIEKSL